jgi:putative FmdB family regulatory protein
MPMYQYRREDGSTFDLKQKFSDEPLTVDPVTGQRVVRVVQAAGIVFKGSGFYVNDSKNASRKSVNNTATSSKTDKADAAPAAGGDSAPAPAPAAATTPAASSAAD